MEVSIFGSNGWKTPIHAPKIGVLKVFDLWVQRGQNPKRHIPVEPSNVKIHLLVWRVGEFLQVAQEGPRDALVSRNSATTKHPIWKLEFQVYRMALGLFVCSYV